MGQFTAYTKQDRDFQRTLKEIEALKDWASRKKLPAEIAKALAIAERDIHKGLSEQVKATFGPQFKINEVYKTYTYGTWSTLGKRVIKRGFLYQHKPMHMSLFPISYYWGNLREKKPRQGWVHLAKIFTAVGEQKIYGDNWRNKEGYGGFIPRDSDGRIVYTRSPYPDQMFVRLTRAKYPVKLIFGPSLADMAGYAWKNPEPSLQRIFDESSKAIADASIGFI
jgi:hypothetical protein